MYKLRNGLKSSIKASPSRNQHYKVYTITSNLVQETLMMYRKDGKYKKSPKIVYNERKVQLYELANIVKISEKTT